MGDVLFPQSFGALLLRLGAMIRPTSHEVGYSSCCTTTDAVRFFLRVTICFLSSCASKKRSFFSFRKLGLLLFGGPLVGVGAPTPCRGALPERRLSFLNLTRRTRFSSGEPLGGVGAPTPCRGGAPRAETFLSWTRLEGLSSPRGLARNRSRAELKRRECVRAYC